MPKCLVRVGGRPLLDLWLDNFRAAGVDEVLVNLHHLPEQVRSHLAAHRGGPGYGRATNPSSSECGDPRRRPRVRRSDEVFLASTTDDLTDFDLSSW